MDKAEARSARNDARFEKWFKGMEKLAKIGQKETAELRRMHRKTDKKMKALIRSQKRTDKSLKDLADAQKLTEVSLRRFLDSRGTNACRNRGLGRINGRGCFRNRHLLMYGRGSKLHCNWNYVADGDHNPTIHVRRKTGRFHAKLIRTDWKLESAK